VDAFLDVVLADEEFVRKEFAAIVAAGWGTPPAPESPGDEADSPGPVFSPGPRIGPGVLAPRRHGRWPRSPP